MTNDGFCQLYYFAVHFWNNKSTIELGLQSWPLSVQMVLVGPKIRARLFFYLSSVFSVTQHFFFL